MLKMILSAKVVWLCLFVLGLPFSALVAAQSPTPHEVVYINDAGELVAMNPTDASQRVLMTLSDPLGHSYGLYPSQDGAYLAVFIRSNDLVVLPELRLVILESATGQSLWDENLLPEGYEYPIEAPLGDPAYELSRALGEVVWSPDSRYVAFIGQESGQADVMVFEPATKTVTSFVSPATAAFIQWHPNSAGVIFADLNSFGDGSGFQVAGYYSAALADGSVSALTLPEPANVSGMALVGWIDETNFIYSPYSFIFGASGIFRYDLTTHNAAEILPARLAIGIPIFDSASRTIAFVVPDVSTAGLVPGAYLWPLDELQPTLLQSGPFYSVQSPRVGWLQYEGATGSYLLDPASATPTLAPLPAHQFGAYLSPQSDAVVLARDGGVYVSSLASDDAALVWADQTQVPIWSPDGASFYSYGFLDDSAGLIEVNTLTRQARLLDSRMAVNSPRAVIQ